jgi:uncharacterized membrane protein SirB2
MSLQVYKIIHLVSLFALFTSFSVSLFGSQKSKFFKIFAGIATILVLVSGMGLMARSGIGHGTGWPLWIKMKFVIWGIVAVIIPIMIKRLPSLSTFTYVLMMSLFTAAVYLVNYRP